MSSLKVALLVPEFHGHKGPGGGINTMAENLAADLSARADVELEIVSLRMARNAPESHSVLAPRSWLRGPTIGRRQYGNVTVHDVGAWLAELEVFRYLPRRRLTQLLRRFDVIVALAGSPAAAYAARHVDRPLICYAASLVATEREGTRGSSRWSLPSSLQAIMTGLVGRLERRALALSDLTIAINPTMQARYGDLGARRTTLLAPGVDVDAFAPIGGRLRGGPILCVGRLSDPRKGLERLVEAFAAAVRQEPGMPDLVLAGRTAPGRTVLDLIVQLGVRERVRVISPVPADELPGLYQSASQFVISSHEEGFGIVAIEAMAAGLPVVATNTEGSTYALGADGNGGILVDRGAGATKELEAALLRLQRDPEGADDLGQRARLHVVETFSRSAVSSRFVRLLRDAVDSNGSRDDLDRKDGALK